MVAGIHGRENEGAYSIVLSGVYEDDQDDGEEFFYSGCGGKEKDPRKRLSNQVADQTLKRHNKYNSSFLIYILKFSFIY